MIELLAIAVFSWMPFVWYMSTNYAVVKDTSQEGMILYGLVPTVKQED